MKAKFYKGSYHGKTRNVRDSDLMHGLVVAKVPDARMWAKDIAGELSVSWGQEVYEMVMMSVTINGVTYTAPAMHPDGSIFLVKRS